MRSVLAALGALAASLVLLFAGLALGGYDAAAGVAALVSGSVGSPYAFFSGTLVRAIPITLIALGFMLGQRGGVLNIGAEGQFYAGAIAATWVGLHAAAWPGPLAWGAVLAAGTLAGAAWVALPTFLRFRLGVLEVISTLLLNFVAEALVSLMVTGPLQEPTRVYPQSAPIAAGAQLPLWPGTRLHLGWLLVLSIAAVLRFVLSRTWAGFALRAVGAGPRAAAVSGRLDAARIGAVALLLSGACAGLAGSAEVSGVSYALYANLSPGYGFTGIAVALLARGDPWGIVAAGVLFGGLEAGAGAMQREAGIPAVVVYVAEAVVIVVVLLRTAVRWPAWLGGGAADAGGATVDVPEQEPAA